MPEIESMVIDDGIAKALAIAIVKLCFRDTCLENYGSGAPNWADLSQVPQATVIHAGGATPLGEVRRFTQAESQAFRREATEALYTILLNLRDPIYLKTIVRYGKQGFRKWDRPRIDSELQVIPSCHKEQVPKILLGDFMSSKLAFGIVKMALDCEEMSGLESGVEPVSQTGDLSDIRIVCNDCDVSWQEVGRISDGEMQTLVKRWADRTYTVFRQLHDTKFLITALQLGAEVEAQEQPLKVVPYLASPQILTLGF